MPVWETKKSIFIWLAILLLTSAACTPTARQKAPEFSSFDAFVEALERVAQDGKRKDVNVFWDSLVDNEQVPFVLGDEVAFLYRGRARSVSWVGDFTEWQNGPALDGHRGGRSNIWVAYATLPSNARQLRSSQDAPRTGELLRRTSSYSLTQSLSTLQRA